LHLGKRAVVAFESAQLAWFCVRADEFIRRDQIPSRGGIRAAERQRFFDSFSEPIPAVSLAQPEQLDHRPRARLWAVPFPQALPQTVEAFRPAPAFAPLLQRTDPTLLVGATSCE